MIKERLSRLHADITLICKRLGRDPKEIILVGITKFAAAAEIEEALDAGLSHIGENKTQQAQQKYLALKPRERQVIRHMVGHLQTNKVKTALNVFDIIQSLDTLKLAVVIEKYAGRMGKTAEVFVQVNTSGEPQKFGVDVAGVWDLLDALNDFHHIKVTGLMTIAPYGVKAAIVRACFRKLQELWHEGRERYRGSSSVCLRHLSMGMSDDYPIALEEGADMIRIGRAIFQ